MYLSLMNNLDRFNLIGGKFTKVHPITALEEQKPFLLFTPTDLNETYLSFVYGNSVYITAFASTNNAIIARLRTVIELLDQEAGSVDLPVFLVRSGIPIDRLSFADNVIIREEINVWKALQYQYTPKRRITSLLADLRELLYL